MRNGSSLTSRSFLEDAGGDAPFFVPVDTDQNIAIVDGRVQGSAPSFWPERYSHPVTEADSYAAEKILHPRLS